MTTPLIEVATPAHRAAVVATVVAAFAADPAFRFFCPDDSTFQREAEAIAGGLFDARVGHGTVWVADGGAAVAMWDGPDAPPSSHEPTGRFAVYERAVAAVMPTHPRWYLGVLACHPAHRGRRLARAAMVPALERAAADGLPALLETSNPGNVEVYRRVGFDVIEHLTVGDELPVWIMRRP
ncbi:GNAT family N-acetyltransferase [Dactylosporangium aurantiacum]|uniref:GNAT family N-acetyltransferase n=1 Tax=Dactylosporangium aurantiacum TaxID=35754 RepID=A0A9Q9IEH2_9ACTN|nr:GNAT family N-acetyltransferase [Dactylosporangium aurantiacum]MDG6101622.1 GNAT family N-acetyltransferase [Dactylosporangium aurantiacum]UWZ52552.1 GNAT family N-acetyltransferase [Dactylosporangium aurantiacum]